MRRTVVVGTREGRQLTPATSHHALAYDVVPQIRTKMI